MAYGSSTQSASGGTRLDVHEVLFKSDRPRAIDRYIDYFGGAGEPLADGDEAGDIVLERPA